MRFGSFEELVGAYEKAKGFEEMSPVTKTPDEFFLDRRLKDLEEEVVQPKNKMRGQILEVLKHLPEPYEITAARTFVKRSRDGELPDIYTEVGLVEFPRKNLNPQVTIAIWPQSAINYSGDKKSPYSKSPTPSASIWKGSFILFEVGERGLNLSLATHDVSGYIYDERVESG